MKTLKTIVFAFVLIPAFSTGAFASSGEGKQMIREVVTTEAQNAYELFSRKSEKEGAVHVIFRINENSKIEVVNVYGPGGPQLWGLTMLALNGKTVHVEDALMGKELSMKISYQQQQ